MTLALASVLDTAAAGPLRTAMRKAVDRGQPIVIDASAVERAGQACLQVLIAAAAAAASAGIPFRLEASSEAYTDMATLAGLPTLVRA
ncbi:MAG TPA: STAS domain-containing protein [Sphingomonas sp.]|nr:STAS domain-containing protein [Sphingomonas sp.]